MSASDWRLFQELEAQADCLITHGGYLRSLASGKLDNILQIGTKEDNADLARWREANGLAPQPAIVVASSSLNFTLPLSVVEHKQKIYIATGDATKRDKIRRWEDLGYKIIIAGNGSLVEGEPLVKALGNFGFRSLYLVAGPQMLETMLRHRKLTCLYLTITHQILGGKKFHSIFPGEELAEKGNLRMKSLYYDPHVPERAGQWFAQFESVG